jgi:hypothetical protein
MMTMPMKDVLKFGEDYSTFGVLVASVHPGES